MNGFAKTEFKNFQFPLSRILPHGVGLNDIVIIRLLAIHACSECRVHTVLKSQEYGDFFVESEYLSFCASVLFKGTYLSIMCVQKDFTSHT